MSGHSKWSSIKHKKATVDARRGQAFTKLIREITVAARLGGGDEQANPRLRAAIQAARDGNMPKGTIERAVKKGAGELEGVSYEDVTYEGYGPAGVAIMVEASTDNKNRMAAEIRHLFSKHSGNLGDSGCVSYLFSRKGQVFISRSEEIDEETVMEAALEAGADDIEATDDAFIVVTGWQEIFAVREALEFRNIIADSASIAMIPSTTIHVEGKEAEALIRLIAALEECDDVNRVSSNYDIDDAVLEKMMG